VDHNFDDTLIGRENRKSNYRTWSERAVVIGFNDEEESYDIVITTEKTLGNNLRSLNRTIRKVKAVVRPSVRTYLPGESILVGYVDDRREHPIIIGLGDSSGHTCIKVTLGVTSTTPTIEGPAAPSVEDPEFNVFFSMSLTCFDPNGSDGSSTIAAGSTNGECTIDCSASEPEIRFTVINGKSSYTWTLPLMGPAGCSFGGVGGPSLGPPTPDGVNDSRLVVTGPDNVGGAGVAAFEDSTRTGACTTHGGDLSPCVAQPVGCKFTKCCIEQGGRTFIERDCNDDFVAGSFSDAGPPSPSVEYIESNNAESIACAAATGWIFTPDVGGISQALIDRLAPTISVDVRSQAMIDGGCCPCGLAFAGLLVTVSDSADTMITITIELADES